LPLLKWYRRCLSTYVWQLYVTSRCNDACGSRVLLSDNTAAEPSPTPCVGRDGCVRIGLLNTEQQRSPLIHNTRRLLAAAAAATATLRLSWMLRWCGCFSGCGSSKSYGGPSLIQCALTGWFHGCCFINQSVSYCAWYSLLHVSLLSRCRACRRLKILAADVANDDNNVDNDYWWSESSRCSIRNKSWKLFVIFPTVVKISSLVFITFTCGHKVKIL